MLAKTVPFISLLFLLSVDLTAQTTANLYATRSLNSFKGKGSNSVPSFEVQVRLDTATTSLIVRVSNPHRRLLHLAFSHASDGIVAETSFRDEHFGNRFLLDELEDCIYKIKISSSREQFTREFEVHPVRSRHVDWH